jgi:uncharacterized NAD(P)/FAD-binding protein YdhS
MLGDRMASPTALTPALQALADELDAATSLDSTSLSRTLDRAIGIDDVAPWIRFDPVNYVRSLVARGDRWELRLLCWRPGQMSSLHSHRGCACAFRVVRGSVTETVLGSRDRVHAPGAVVEEAGTLRVHQVANAGSDAALTLHAYAPALDVDAPSPRQGRNVVIVGGGASGAAVAMHLLRRGDPSLRITLVERGPWLGRGIAYGVDSRTFLLNVPASKMSLDPETPDDFQRWAGAAPADFLPRTAFGAYVVERLAESIRSSRAKLRVVRGEAVAIGDHGVRLAGGPMLEAEVVVLATGIEPRVVPSQLPADHRIVDAWDEAALAALPGEGRLLVLGAGLSALDVLAWLDARDFRGSVTILSRRGLLPGPHLEPSRAATPLTAEAMAAAPRSLRGLLRWGRAIVEDHVARGEPWQLAIDALRPHTRSLFHGMAPRDRARFVRSVRPYWDILRHRAPAQARARVDAMRSAGRLEVVAGRVLRCEPDVDGLTVEVATARGPVRVERYDRIVRCIGPALERTEGDTPLVRDLVASGLAAPDPAGLGIVTDDLGRVVNASGAGSEALFAIGAPRRASAWETTAIPDISVQAAAIARRISG